MSARRWQMMVGLTVGLAVSVGLTGACSGLSQVRERQMTVMAENPEALIQVRRPGCLIGDCPVYGVSVFMDGSVVYEGRSNVATLGVKRGKISPEGLNELISALHDVRFLDSAEACCVCPDQEAARPVVLDYRPGTVQKTVFHDRACAGAPREMAALEETIERAAGVAQWTTAPARPVPLPAVVPAAGTGSAVAGAASTRDSAPIATTPLDGDGDGERSVPVGGDGHEDGQGDGPKDGRKVE